MANRRISRKKTGRYLRFTRKETYLQLGRIARQSKEKRKNTEKEKKNIRKAGNRREWNGQFWEEYRSVVSRNRGSRRWRREGWLRFLRVGGGEVWWSGASFTVPEGNHQNRHSKALALVGGFGCNNSIREEREETFRRSLTRTIERYDVSRR